MADPTTTNLGLAVPVRGTDVGTWDIPVNGDMTIIDACFGAVTTKSLTNVNIALTATEALCSIITLTGTLTGNVTVTLPAIYKTWTIKNKCVVGSFVVTLSGGSGNIIGLPPGSCQASWDSVNVEFVNYKALGEFWDHPVTALPPWITACSVPPALLCNGGTFSTFVYPQLFGMLGTNTLPQSSGALRATLNQGTGNITTAGSGIDGNTRFSSGGAQNLTLAQSALPNATLALTGSQTVTLQSSLGGTPRAPASGSLSTPLTATGSAGVYATTSYGDINPFTINFSNGATASINGAVTQTTVNKMPPTYIGGITMIWAV